MKKELEEIKRILQNSEKAIWTGGRTLSRLDYLKVISLIERAMRTPVYTCCVDSDSKMVFFGTEEQLQYEKKCITGWKIRDAINKLEQTLLDLVEIL